MDLMCREASVSESVSPDRGELRLCRIPDSRAAPDPALSGDAVLHNLLKAEDRHPPPSSSYFSSTQTEITPPMRTMLADWMLEVCEEQRCQEEVFPLAMSYVDRFMAACTISKNCLQLLGTTCLLLASKLREPSTRGLDPRMLVFYTDNSITLGELYEWELLVLCKLKWDMATVTAQDFLELLVMRLHLGDIVHRDTVIRHAQTFIALATKDYQFTMYTASTLAASSVAAALQGLEWGTKANVSLQELLTRLHDLTGIEQDYLQSCLEQIEQMVQKTIEERTEQAGGEDSGNETASGTSDWNRTTLDTSDKLLDKAGTPTDVRDVHF